MQSTRKQVITYSIIVIVLIIGVIGASYAYFAAYIGSSVQTTTTVATKTVDNLIFTSGNAISITANQSNFKSGAGDLSGSTTSTAKLTAGNDHTANYKYRVYFLISENNYIYTKNSSTPELTLTITKNGTTVVNAMDVTTRTGLINIPNPSSSGSVKQSITAEAGATTTDTWVATVTFKNFTDHNQAANAGKSFKAILMLDESPNLPSGYQEVEYITTSGTQYFNLNISATQNYKFHAIFKTTSSVPAGRGILGYYNGGQTNNYYLYVSGNSNWQFGYYTYENLGPTFTANTIYEVSNNAHVLTVNGSNYNHATASAFSTSPNNLYLWNLNGGTYSGLPLNAYYFKLWDGTTLVRNMVPCYRTSDSVIGMYDTVGKTFYTNAGSGAFTKGDNIS